MTRKEDSILKHVIKMFLSAAWIVFVTLVCQHYLTPPKTIQELKQPPASVETVQPDR